MNKKYEAKIKQLMALAIKLNREDFHVWLDFSGHVDWINVRWAHGGWCKNKEVHNSSTAYTTDGDIKSIELVIEELQNASDNNKLLAISDAEKAEQKEREQYEKLKEKYGEAA